jgi:glycosyltransferase involved in cell wall biosynthesis
VKGNRVKFTVIIPTRERADTLQYSLKTCGTQDYDNLEILVSDNNSQDNTKEVVESFKDPRIRYINTGKRVSMSHNWEFALSHVNDGWVLILGDDDGLLPGCLNRVEQLIRETNTKAIIPNCCTFIWPNEDNHWYGRLLIPMRRGFEIRDPKKWLKRVVDGRAWYAELPMLYAGGLMHNSLIDKIRGKRGTFFQSCQPDIFSSIAFASVTDSYVYSHEPFAIAGHSRHSNGASWAASARGNSNATENQPIEIFLSEGNIPFHHDVPLNADGNFPVSIDLLVFESYQQASYLHGNSLSVSPESQLPLFLARDIEDKERMDEWVCNFANLHKLDISRARARVPLLKARLKWDLFNEYAAAFVNFYRIEPSFGLRIRDVFEASLVAETVLRIRPNRLKSYISTLRKWKSKLLKMQCTIGR